MSHDPTDLRAEAERDQESEEAKRIRALQEAADVRWLMRQSPFRRFMLRHLEKTGMWQDFFSESQAATNRFLGIRSVGLELMVELTKHAPELVDVMLSERRKKEEMKANAG
jgi:hypothetical protein